MLLDPDPPIDWQVILLDLVRAGWKLRHIAFAINAPASTVQRWWGPRRSEPHYEYGRRLLKLHSLVMALEAKKNAVASIPKTSPAYKSPRPQTERTVCLVASAT